MKLIAIKRIVVFRAVKWALIVCQLLAVVACSVNGPERSSPRIFWPLDEGGAKLEFVGNFHSDLDFVPLAEQSQFVNILLVSRQLTSVG